MSVSIEDVRQVLGESSYDVGTLCLSSKIDKWARYKPLNYPALFSNNGGKGINDSFGLSPITVSGGTSTTNDTGAMSQIIQMIIANGGDWTYDRPKGGESSPYRLVDFDGYQYGVRPPLYMELSDGEHDVSVGALKFRLRFNDDGAQSTGGLITYSEVKPFQGNDWYLWVFMSSSSDFTQFDYARSDDPVTKETTVSVNVSTTGTKYFVFAFGNKDGNKFMTIPNSYKGELITKYPVAVKFTANSSGFVDFEKTDGSIDLSCFWLGQEGNLCSIQEVLDYKETTGTDYVFFVGSDQSLYIEMQNLTFKNDTQMSGANWTCYFGGVTMAPSLFMVDGSDYTVSSTTVKGGTSVTIDLKFDDAFMETDKEVSEYRNFDPIVKYNGNTFFSFGGRDLHWSGATAHGKTAGTWDYVG